MRTVDNFHDLCELEDLGFELKGNGVFNAIAIVAYCDGITKGEAIKKIFSVNCEDFEEFITPYFNSIYGSYFFTEDLAKAKKPKGIWAKIKKLLTRK